ncbi:hypothetical protein [Bacillus massiliglaciei]|uniref:hypothetical protein n=1 Tax=Bacillus massiliglaciei TaxID=1816693 RepID=UPI000DA6074E|nr:hypothetical protein [Bacillus massiliglaciei]
MDLNGFNLEESQKRLMELLVSRTLRKHGVKTDKLDLSEKEKRNLRETVELLKQQSELIINQKTKITEHDVNPVTKKFEDR